MLLPGTADGHAVTTLPIITAHTLCDEEILSRLHVKLMRVTCCAACLMLQKLLFGCMLRLIQLIQHVPEQPQNWTITTPLTCSDNHSLANASCARCQELAAFMRDPVARVTVITTSSKLCQHLAK